jgi:riboflavin kinase/FMN adenylyltransferase
MSPLLLRGVVVRGAGLGRRLGFPTANLKLAVARFPPYGVYRVEASWRGSGGRRPAVCSVGVRPTLGPSGEVWVEVHVLDFDGDLYDRT